MIDLTVHSDAQGAYHPVTLVMHEVVRVFAQLGYEVVLGSELEDEYYNFDALNVPAHHPARDMQDTFWIKGHVGKVLRTHTSPMQVRYLESKTKSGQKPPFAIVVPGKVFRNEATDATHEMQFHQIEGLVVSDQVSMADLKGTLLHFFKAFLGEEVEMRFRPSFFPFVEPGVEVDVFFGGRWLEVLGAGMVHPHVLSAGGIDSTQYRGFAFGMGLDRLISIKYGITDIRTLYQGDLRLNQF